MRKDGVKHKLALAVIACGIVASTFCAVDPSLTLDSPVCTNGVFGFTLNGQYGTRYVIESSTDLQAWTPVLTNDGPEWSRTLSMNASNDLAFYRAKQGPWVFKRIGIVARTNINLSGNAISIDSFDSSDIINFPGGQWNLANRRANGNVASKYGIINIGNSLVRGKLFTGPSGSTSLGPNGSVGDDTWVTGGNAGIEPGSLITNFSMVLPDVTAPYTSGAVLPAAVRGTNTLSTGTYYYSGTYSVPNGATVQVGSFQYVVIYVTGGFSMSGTARVDIQQGGTLVLYVGGPSTVLTTINNQGNAATFQYYGLSSNSSISLSSSDAFLGTIYAPEATLTLSAGGGGAIDLVGAFIVNNFVCNSSINIHFDENLFRP